MEINLEGNRISLNILNERIVGYQDSQLGFYGYDLFGKTYAKDSEDVESDILQLKDYLESEGYELNFSKESQKTLSRIFEKGREYSFFFRRAKQVKDGVFEEESYRDFLFFLSGLPRRLKPHQVKAAFHLYSVGNGANFSVPGSGKTSVVLSVYEKLRIEGKCNLIFVVGPPASFQPWQFEFKETIGRPPKPILLAGGNKDERRAHYYEVGPKTELYLTTFQTILNDFKDVIKLLNQSTIRAFLVIDEAHYMKQIGGSWAGSLLQVAKYAEHRCILTGTPMPKSYKDVFNPFDFLWPMHPPLNDEDKIRIELWEKSKKDDMISSLLNERVGPLFYRVRKKDLGLTSPVFHKPIVISMKYYERKLYDYVSAKIVELTERDFIENIDVLSQLWKGRMMRMRQLVSYPKLLFSAIDNYDNEFLIDSEIASIVNNYDELEVPGKVEKLIELVLEIREKNQKVLIWANFIGSLELIKNTFLNMGYKCELIYGQTPLKSNSVGDIVSEKTRDEIREEFVDQGSGLDILVANPAACSESISLHKTCFHAIYFDLSYNCAQYLQSLDRIHRVGGSEQNMANYYFLQYANSIDQDIKKNVELKAERMYRVVDRDYEIYDLNMSEDNDDDDISAYKRLFKVN